jgi:hypothetical protein
LEKRRLKESAPITGGECFHPLRDPKCTHGGLLLFSAAIVRVFEFLAALRVEVRTEKPVWGSQGVLCLLSLALERKGAVEDIRKDN